MRGMSGSGPLGVEAHIVWFGQPAQASPWPASFDSGPGQCSGSGAIRVGCFLSGAERSTWMLGSWTVVVVVEGMLAMPPLRQVLLFLGLHQSSYELSIVSRCILLMVAKANGGFVRCGMRAKFIGSGVLQL